MDRETVLVTGSSRGIGFAVAEKFAYKDYNIILNCSTRIDEMNRAAAKISAINPNVMAVQSDVSSYSESKRMFSQIWDRFGNIDVLVNNAGIASIGLFQDTAPSLWRQVIGTNLFGVLNCTHLALPSMISNKRGAIINISSIWGHTGASCESVYAASKAGVNTFTKSLARELGPCGIRINAVACGLIDTGMNNCFSEDERVALMEDVPLMRFGNTEEIAHLVYFLCSDEASYITGQVINIDGGWM